MREYLVRWRIAIGTGSGRPAAAELAEIFKPFGDLEAVEVYTDAATGRSQGFGYAHFGTDQSRQSAYAALNGREFAGIRLYLTLERQYDPIPTPRGPLDLARWTPHDKGSDTRRPLATFVVPSHVLKITGEVNARLLGHIFRNPRLLKSSDVTPRLFEEIIAEIWHGFGYAVELTKQTRDGGRDIIAVRSLHVDERYLIECKRPTTDRKIDVRIVRELYGVTRHEKATKGILATTAYFSPDARLFVQDHRWELDAKDYDGVQQWLRQYFDLSSDA